ncbi:MAG: NAD(P)-dependent oxidoreductase [Hoeflea sp.]|uniref:NAD(P)-dependent oxidoreductase n=1 Tax=Hoeflea sp. TaxID=1940281 RepID=UPI001D298341|nr:NAD(P)-dependent oxidoreductase [Hoeflea sp.]MBU4528612.1 NAD(P)-dependent oxidoreductase [Alphaproteobacteria bacterium]MBU4545583.1 NAD(P)-dependent oxidoreductase [Alphaproteobacteria bacterium]MBU4552193.1 NAD(P)-dependent oxidoreductase [Alphaproteobacteria bacterium]MBV1726215.1 NAD(P)-dependent oxidoreductase [Hoeflea sp.]MBV1762358.1 NAD(P)-dependent oxidoreductase [Hoeflea sp.]
MTTSIAVLGTGLMGLPMARRLLGAGFDLTVWNRDPSKSAPLAAEGARIARDPKDAVSRATHIITMLTDGAVVNHVLFETGVAGAITAGATVIDMSSIRPSQARDHASRLAKLGVHHLDAPVSGGTKGAEAGTLAIMAGGEQPVFDEAADLFKPLGRAVRVGPSGAGQLAKLANQAIVGITIGAVAEATLLVSEGGGDLEAFRSALSGGFADSAILQQHGARMQAGDFKPGGRVLVQIKDLDNILIEAGELGIRLPLVEAVRDRFVRLAENLGGGDLDHSALFLELLDLNKLSKTPRD